MNASILVVIMLAIAGPNHSDEPTPASRLLGKWQVEKVVIAGKDESPGELNPIYFVFEAKTYKVMRGDSLFAEYSSYTVDTRITPWLVVAEFTNSDEGPTKVYTYRSLYRFVDGGLEQCEEITGKFPKGFTSTPQDRQILRVFRKVKE